MTAAKKISSWSETRAVLAAMVPQFVDAQHWNEYRVWEVWEEIVGEALARKAYPTRMRNGKLFVIVSHSILMQELQFVKGLLRERLNTKLGRPVVRDIMFVIGRVRERILRQNLPTQRPLPAYTELSVPPLGRPALEAALTKLLEARRRRLLEKEGRHERITNREPSKKI